MSDTSRDAVERYTVKMREVARVFTAPASRAEMSFCGVADLLEALVAERDAAVARAEAAERERDRMRRGWLTTIQVENSCPATGGGCLAKRCGCVEEMKMLLDEDDARAALGEPRA